MLSKTIRRPSLKGQTNGQFFIPRQRFQPKAKGTDYYPRELELPKVATQLASWQEFLDFGVLRDIAPETKASIRALFEPQLDDVIARFYNTETQLREFVSRYNFLVEQTHVLRGILSSVLAYCRIAEDFADDIMSRFGFRKTGLFSDENLLGVHGITHQQFRLADFYVGERVRGSNRGGWMSYCEQIYPYFFLMGLEIEVKARRKPTGASQIRTRVDNFYRRGWPMVFSDHQDVVYWPRNTEGLFIDNPHLVERWLFHADTSDQYDIRRVHPHSVYDRILDLGMRRYHILMHVQNICLEIASGILSLQMPVIKMWRRDPRFVKRLTPGPSMRHEEKELRRDYRQLESNPLDTPLPRGIISRV